jgi:hypothetical protein
MERYLHLDVGGLDHWGPARDLALNQGRERLLASALLFRDVTSEIDQALANAVVI